MPEDKRSNKDKINKMSEDIAVMKSQLEFINSTFRSGGKFENFCELAIQNSNSIRWMKIIGSVVLTGLAVFVPYIIAIK